MTESEQLVAAMNEFPPLWVIYDHPADYPNDVVIRVWYGETPGSVAVVCDTIAEARAKVVGQGATTCLGRYDDDDPVIVETWV